jgi:hypothetical protein
MGDTFEIVIRDCFVKFEKDPDIIVNNNFNLFNEEIEDRGI